jgi:S-adenosylmethionine-dependent methyltransferase
MTEAQDKFAHLLDYWKKYPSLPWGYLQYSTSRFNITRHLGSSPLRILDVGGGNGMNSIYYAKQGHFVTLFDCSPAMLNEARVSA